MNPFLSIIIPCYNQAHFLGECLDSILIQKIQDWEALVINDGSPDDTNEVVLSYSKKDTRIKLVQKCNGGLSSARNYGISHASGERFIFLDADDFLYPDCLRKIADKIKDSDEYDLIQYGYTYVKEDGKTILGHTNAQKKENLIPDIFKSNLGPCHSICISRELAEASGSFDETLKSVEDWDFWTRAIKAGGKQKIIPQMLVYYRYAQNSMSRDGFIMYNALKTVIERGPKKDARITISSELNRDYDFDVTEVLKEVLLRSLGVSVMQGKIKDSIQFFNQNTPKNVHDYKPEEFEYMCSYLSFRYWYSANDIAFIFKEVYPNFELFFKELRLSSKVAQKALFGIFKRHSFYQNHYRYGAFLGKIINRIERFRNQ